MILVTGGAGFIGSNLIKKLNDDGDKDIIIVDELGNEDKWKNVNSLKFNRIISPQVLPQLFARPDFKPSIIFHLGACTNTREERADYLIEHNFNYPSMLFMHAQAFKIPFIYASSAAVYGDGSHGFSDDDFTTQKLTPLNKYGFSKAAFDKWVLNQPNKQTFWAGLRFFNVYGPGEHHKTDMWSPVFRFYQDIKMVGKATVFEGSEELKRDFIHVNDVVKVILGMAKNCKPTLSGIYNVGTGVSRSFIELGNCVHKSFNGASSDGSDLFFNRIPAPVRGYQRFTESKNEKLMHAFSGILTFTSLEDGVKDYVDYLKAYQQ